jgi:hypothetical protein
MGFPRPWVLTRKNIEKVFKSTAPQNILQEKHRLDSNIKNHFESQNIFSE